MSKTLFLLSKTTRIKTYKEDLFLGLSKKEIKNYLFQFNRYKEIVIKVGFEDDCNGLWISNTNLKEFTRIYFRNVKRDYSLACSIATFAHNNRIPFYDSYLEGIKYGDKLFQMVTMFFNGILIPKTIYLSSDIVSNKFSFLEENLHLPFVAKETDTNKGVGVYLINNNEEFESFVKTMKRKCHYIFQEYIPNDFDYRILVLGNNIPVVSSRTRVSDEWRNNSFLGAKENTLEADKNPKDLVDIGIKASRIMKCEIAGVDIIISKKSGKLYLIEINNSPGFTPESLEALGLRKLLLEKN